ncbi:hypothetical protein N7457_005186 [Penicillium paradoxum]|uniref:uncharacterized protein n=1 Tax=Penicillium paradoxum TaxID=176176 RepID=UPI0025481797|nr:uncharacterized protein N7457_005186 [Penicillium paradoxum]KAJ5780026.1 hypothetical protein N7457_005186 [Penicillium paradoxum]
MHHFLPESNGTAQRSPRDDVDSGPRATDWTVSSSDYPLSEISRPNVNGDLLFHAKTQSYYRSIRKQKPIPLSGAVLSLGLVNLTDSDALIYGAGNVLSAASGKTAAIPACSPAKGQ